MNASPHGTQIIIDLFRLYTGQELSDITEVRIRNLHDKLLMSISDIWQIEYHLLPSDETFYTAIRRSRCSPAMREKMAMFYYYIKATTEAERKRIKADYLKLGKEQRPIHTPYWHSYVAEQEQKVVLIETQLAFQEPQEQTAQQQNREELLQKKKEAEALLKKIKKELKEMEDKKK